MFSLQVQMKQVMAEKNITAYQLSKDTSINEGQLSRFFSNKVDLSLKKVLQIIEYLDCNLSIEPRKHS